jgi:hypothetical protein
MEISEAVFVGGTAVAGLEFDCGPNNPTPIDILLDLARKHDAAVKNGLPSLALNVIARSRGLRNGLGA